TPINSNSFLNPVDTPSIMLAINERVVPWIERLALLSFGRVKVISLSAISNEIAGDSSRVNSPFGPLTVAVVPFSSTVTPDGITTGFLPIRLTVPHLLIFYNIYLQITKRMLKFLHRFFRFLQLYQLLSHEKLRRLRFLSHLKL